MLRYTDYDIVFREIPDETTLAVNLAGDADTVGAVTGQIAGAVFGASAIPQSWLGPLAWREQLEALAAQLVRLTVAPVR